MYFCTLPELDEKAIRNWVSKFYGVLNRTNMEVTVVFVSATVFGCSVDSLELVTGKDGILARNNIMRKIIVVMIAKQ